MGQQAYEMQLKVALNRWHSERWKPAEISVVPIRSRSALSSASVRRVPLRVAWSAPYMAAAAIGRLSYGRANIVHRLDLRCPPSGRLEVVTIHDLPPLRFGDEGSLPAWAARSARAAAAVICPSEFAAAEVRELLGVECVHVVPYGIDHDRANATPFTGEELRALGLNAPVVVHAAGATTRKNLHLLAQAWPRVLAERPEVTLALCGPPDDRRTRAFADVANVRFLGFRPPGFIARLIKSAQAVVVPSIYEGFGLPTLEAMIAGTPVVATTCGAIPEIAGKCAILVPPADDVFARGVIRALAGGEEMQQMCSEAITRARTYSWERCARDTVAVYDAAIESS